MATGHRMLESPRTDWRTCWPHCSEADMHIGIPRGGRGGKLAHARRDFRPVMIARGRRSGWREPSAHRRPAFRSMRCGNERGSPDRSPVGTIPGTRPSHVGKPANHLRSSTSAQGFDRLPRHSCWPPEAAVARFWSVRSAYFGMTAWAETRRT